MVNTVTGDTSDGYHTFKELYDHRMALTQSLMRLVPNLSWRSLQHNPIDAPMFEGFFVVGIDLPTGAITYHYKLRNWALFEGVKVLEHAPQWDGATPDETILRLLTWHPHG